jgi:5-methyltetrahydrofolate--homocysteine methyltransferase
MRPDSTVHLQDLLTSRIAILDGAMGTTIRDYGLDEQGARGKRFADAPKDLLNNGDILSLTQPDTIGDIHKRFLEAGSDIIETNTFSATTLSQAEFFVEDPREQGGRKDPDFFQKILENEFLCTLVEDLNLESSRLAREQADRLTEETGIRRYVAGAIGPLTISLSNAPDHDDPSFRPVTFDQVHDSYLHQARALVEGGCDLLLVETIFDSLNAKAALVAIQKLFEETGVSLPLVISAAVGSGGATLISAQRIEAFWIAVQHVHPLAVGLNCCEGPDVLRPFIAELADSANCFTSCYPNAGLPNPLAPTGFDLEPDDMAAYMAEFAQAGMLNIAGGCCGNTPEHIAAISEALKPHAPRTLPA